MEKLKMKSKDLTQENIKKIGELFPNVITEVKDKNGNIAYAIDFELLQQELSEEIVEGSKERYQLTWPGKKEAIIMANTPVNKTLRPIKEESLNWEDTENLYIEGDNLEVLKLLQESYLNKVKCIYIDPPYNTGKDLIYKDKFTQEKDEYLEDSGQIDEYGNRLFQNTEYNGRFHSDWLSMIYPRLKLARNLLAEDGVIFISIDDNEAHNLRKICDEIFGERNYVQEFVWQKKFSPQNDAKYFSLNHENIYCYAKNKQLFSRNLLPMTDEQKERYKNPDNDPRGAWISSDLTVARKTDKDIYEVVSPSGKKFLPPNGRSWSVSFEKMQELISDNRIWFGDDGNSMPRLKRFLTDTNQGIVPISIWYHHEVGHTQSASQELKALFDGYKYFDYPKPVGLIKRMLQIATNKDSLILDFFSGSATTAHAVMELNAEDGGNRKYILVQLPEPCGKNSEAFKTGFRTISDIGKARIRRAGQKIKEETGAEIDDGFRVFRVDTSNMKDVYYRPDELTQDLVAQMESNIKEDRTSLDLLIQVMLETGMELSLPIETKEIHGKQVHFVAGSSLVACFDEHVDEELIKEIAKTKPLKAVFRDSSFKSCPDRINLEEIFKNLSPNTEIRVI